MLVASIHGLRYCRLLTDRFTAEEGQHLASEFDYVFAVCYQGCGAPMFETVQKNACLIDLRTGAEAAFSRFHATARNEVRRAGKIEGLRFDHGPGSDFLAYFPFYKACENARDWFPVPEDEFYNSLIFIAFYDEKPISGMSAYRHEDRLRVGRIFSLKKANDNPAQNNLLFGCAAKRIVYDICRYGEMQGCQSLDLGGLDLDSPEKSGIARFKLSLGGQVAPVALARYANERFHKMSPSIREAGYDIT
jgi:hypothetical protein